MPETGLHLTGLTICKGRDALLHELTASVAPGETLTVMGPSGVGKSTLLAAITGTLMPPFHVHGDIRLNGRDLRSLPTQRRRVGVLLQDHLLFPHLSVGENLAFGLHTSRKERRARVEAALAEIGMEGFGPRDPATLSGGQRARVALMRMLLSEPEALLLDEPFSRLDTELRDRVRKLVFERSKAAGLPVLLVTHDKEDAIAAGGETINLSGRKQASSAGCASR
ncbi:ATP-binding cassette domain-containing protein [Antarctobacter jejuensis]|uniref:ATP-binding cassette domain-containing protein n=1 Tax=Antarctobacter jejuensis TaxID=1439938 RepID=UPI003FD1FF3C